MSKMVGKGTKLQQTIAMSLVDIAQLLSITHSGSAALWFDSTTLDGGVFKTKDHTGFAEGGSVAFELFYDAALSGHQALTDRITTPADNAMKIIYSNATEQSFTGAGMEFGNTIVMDDGVKANATVQVDGDPGWST